MPFEQQQYDIDWTIADDLRASDPENYEGVSDAVLYQIAYHKILHGRYVTQRLSILRCAVLYGVCFEEMRQTLIRHKIPLRRRGRPSGKLERYTDTVIVTTVAPEPFTMRYINFKGYLRLGRTYDARSGRWDEIIDVLRGSKLDIGDFRIVLEVERQRIRRKR